MIILCNIASHYKAAHINNEAYMHLTDRNFIPQSVLPIYDCIPKNKLLHQFIKYMLTHKLDFQLTSSCFALTSGFHPSLLKGCVEILKGIDDGLFATT